jgi:hypothetical protein
MKMAGIGKINLKESEEKIKVWKTNKENMSPLLLREFGSLQMYLAALWGRMFLGHMGG